VVAVEVHQSDPGSSDLSFDVELQASFRNPEAARLELIYFETTPYLFWMESGSRLERSNDLEVSTVNLFAASPLPIVRGGASRGFFRLVR
jgi:hypothetical protein